MLEGLPDLHELNMYGNKVAEIIIPPGRNFLSKLETLNLGYNDLAFLPDDLDQLPALKTLKVMNNFLEKVPMRVCDMDLRHIDVSSNPVVQPPIETCERGICSMKRYYHCLRQEEQAKQKDAEESTKKVVKKKKPAKKPYAGILRTLRRTSEDSQQSGFSNSASSNELGQAASTSMLVAEARNLSEPPPAASTVTSTFEMLKPDEFESAVVSPAGFEVDGATVAESAYSVLEEASMEETVSVNDTLKVIFVGMAMVGKTSMIKRLIEGRDAIIPTHDERTVGVDIYEWDPKKDQRYADIDSRIVFQDKELADTCGDVDVKFSVWDFAGQHVYHATHELFFSQRALYVLVWDMGATNRATLRRKEPAGEESGAFKLTYDSSDDEEEDEPEPENALAAEEEDKRADRALERDIDEKVQFWIDCIQSSAPGAAILPVASFSDCFDGVGGEAEAKRRCMMLKQRLLKHEGRRIDGIKERLRELYEQKRANDLAAVRLRKLLCTYTRPKIIFDDDDNDCVVRVSGTQYTGFRELTAKIIGIATGLDKGKWRYPIFHGHVGARIPRMRLEVRDAVRTMRDRFKVVEWGYFINQLRDRGLTNVEDISDALFFLTNIGELSYFGGVIDNKESVNPIAHAVSGVQISALLFPLALGSLTHHFFFSPVKSRRRQWTSRDLLKKRRASMMMTKT
jgi:GTPase SAR1 family protein